MSGIEGLLFGTVALIALDVLSLRFGRVKQAPSNTRHDGRT
jgi:hypothetical protein